MLAHSRETGIHVHTCKRIIKEKDLFSIKPVSSKHKCFMLQIVFTHQHYPFMISTKAPQFMDYIYTYENKHIRLDFLMNHSTTKYT